MNAGSKPIELVELPRIQAQSFKFPRTFASPCVVVDIAKGWHALTRWTADYLKSVAGESNVVIRRIAGAPRNVYLHLRAVTGSFGEFLEWVVHTAVTMDHLATELRDIRALAAAVDQMGIEESYYLDVPLLQLSATFA